ncbi:MAG: DUF192 domain-containing protein [Pseudomonadota bacterium]
MMRRFAAFAVVLALTAAQPAVAQDVPDCRDDTVHLRNEGSVARFGVELADTPVKRSEGLMFRESMGASQGMLFIYERAQPVAFWMRNTLIPLDMIFMDARGVVQKVHENAVPLDITTIEGGDSIQFVLEINGGLARGLGITEGSVLRHPAIGPEAAWAC